MLSFPQGTAKRSRDEDDEDNDEDSEMGESSQQNSFKRTSPVQ